MPDPSGKTPMASYSFTKLIAKYNKMQSQVTSMVKKLAESSSSSTPGNFLMVQFHMAQVTQAGESISNMISQLNSMINRAVGNIKSQ